MKSFINCLTASFAVLAAGTAMIASSTSPAPNIVSEAAAWNELQQAAKLPNTATNRPTDKFEHPKAKRAFGWSHPENADGTGERFVAVLEIPPVDSPQAAVKMAIYSDIKKGKK